MHWQIGKATFWFEGFILLKPYEEKQNTKSTFNRLIKYKVDR